MNRLLIYPSITLILFLCNYLPVSSAGFKIVSEGNKHGLADDSGTIIIPIIYDNLGWSNGRTDLIDDALGYFENGKWGLISTKNTRISAPDYRDLFPIQNGFIIASRQSGFSDAYLYGVLDTKGKAQLGFQYHSLSLGGNFLVAGQLKDGVMKWGVLDYFEQQIIPMSYDAIEIHHLNFVVYENKAAALFDFNGKQLTDFEYHNITELGSFSLLHDQSGKQGLSDIQGRIITKPEYKSIRLSTDSTATLTELPKWELIVPEKGVVKEFYFDQITPVSHGIYRVSTNDRQAIINIEEEYLLNGNNWEISIPDDQFVIVRQGEKYGILKEGGIQVLPTRFDSIFYSGKHFYALTAEESDLHWQIYSTFGNPISSSRFDQVFPMTENVIATKKNGYWGYIDFSGHTVIEYKYDYAWPFKDGRAKVKYLDNQGIINTAGEWVIYPNHARVTIVNKNLFVNHAGKRLDLLNGSERIVYQTYNELTPHSFGLLEASASNKFGLINHAGKSVIPPVYDYISELSGKQVYVLKKDQRHTVIDRDGGVILEETDVYDEIGRLSEGFLSVKKDRRFGFIDLDGLLRIANRYDAVEDFQEGMSAVQLVGRWGFIDRHERLKIQPLYDQVENFLRGVSMVRKLDSYGIIDMQGVEILPIEYDSVYRNEFNSFIVAKSEKYGLANLKGELLVQPKYELLEENDNDYLIVKQRGKFGVIKKNGINVIPMIYDELLFDQINGYYLAKRAPKEKIISTK